MRFPSIIPRCVPKKIGACGELIIIFNNYKMCAAHSQRAPKTSGISRGFSAKIVFKSDNLLKFTKKFGDDVSQKKIGACGELIIIFNNYKICAARSRRAPKTRRISRGFPAKTALKSDTPLKDHREFGDDVSQKKIGACGGLIIIFNNYKNCAARSLRAPKTSGNSRRFSAKIAFKSDTPLKFTRNWGMMCPKKKSAPAAGL